MTGPLASAAAGPRPVPADRAGVLPLPAIARPAKLDKAMLPNSVPSPGAAAATAEPAGLVSANTAATGLTVGAAAAQPWGTDKPPTNPARPSPADTPVPSAGVGETTNPAPLAAGVAASLSAALVKFTPA